MANAVDYLTRTIPTGSWGHVETEIFDLALANGDAISSTHDLVVLPAGIEIFDATIFTTDAAAAASSTLDVGVKSVSGTNQDDTALLFSVVAITAVAATRKNTTKAPLTLAQKMYLRCTVKGAAQTDASAHRIQLLYRFRGNA